MEKNIWHIEKLLSMAWYVAMIPMNSKEIFIDDKIKNIISQYLGEK